MSDAHSVEKKPVKRKLNASVLSVHHALLTEIRLHRGTIEEEIPDASQVVGEAIVDFAQKVLPEDRFNRVMTGAA